MVSGNTRAKRLNQLVNFRTNTVLYGTKSIKSRAVQAWNDVNVDLHNLKLQDVSKSICKKKVYEYLLEKYPGNNNNNSNSNNGNINPNNTNTNNAANNNLSRINANPYDLSGIRVLTYRRNNTQALNANWTGQGLINRWDNQVTSCQFCSIDRLRPDNLLFKYVLNLLPTFIPMDKNNVLPTFSELLMSCAAGSAQGGWVVVVVVFFAYYLFVFFT